MSSARTISESAGNLASDVGSGKLSVEQGVRQLAELLRETLRLIERLETDTAHLRSICRK